jgi:copper chaperone CopZ
MKVEVLYFEGCPNHAPAVQLAREVLAALGLTGTVEEVEVKNREDAMRLRFLGSPTVLVNGVDVEPSARTRTDFGFCCRTYNGEGLPVRELVAQAMSDASGEGSPHGDCCSPLAARDDGSLQRTAEGRFAVWAAVGSVVSAIVASACCWLPLILLAVGASAAWISASFERARPVFLVVAFGLLGLGFYLSYFRKEACAPGSSCAVPNPKLRRFNRAMLWVSTVFVLAFALFPSYAGLLLAENSSAASKESVAGLATVTLGIEGMSCAACSVHIEKSLRGVPGVRSASVSYAEKQAQVSLDPASPPSQEALTKAVEQAGYKVTNVVSR